MCEDLLPQMQLGKLRFTYKYNIYLLIQRKDFLETIDDKYNENKIKT